jgi:Domain of unknown function (DUF6438)
MIRMVLSSGMLAGLLLSLPVAATAADDAAAPLAKPGDTFVSLQVEGCAAKCPSFEIYVFSDGRMKFRSNNQYTSTKGTHYKNGMPDTYNKIAKYLQDSGAFADQAPCTDSKPDPSVATAQSAHDSQVQKATWSNGCSNQIDKGRAVVKVFVNQTGMWSLIKSDSRYWEKYWETWEKKDWDPKK